MIDAGHPGLVSALIALARKNVAPDVQVLLLTGNPTAEVEQGALGAAVAAFILSDSFVEEVARAWASIDGRLEEFDMGKVGSPPHAAADHYGGTWKMLGS